MEIELVDIKAKVAAIQFLSPSQMKTKAEGQRAR
jgi:hypothetical protein